MPKAVLFTRASAESTGVLWGGGHLVYILYSILNVNKLLNFFLMESNGRKSHGSQPQVLLSEAGELGKAWSPQFFRTSLQAP